MVEKLMLPARSTDVVYKLDCPKCPHRFVSIVREEYECGVLMREALARANALPLVEKHWIEEHPGEKP